MDPIMMTADVVAATLFISSQVLMRLQAARALPKMTARPRLFSPTFKASCRRWGAFHSRVAVEGVGGLGEREPPGELNVAFERSQGSVTEH
jgi:hypothetical protein